MTQPTAFEQFQQFLREMFQYDNNDLDFGLFKVLRLKRSYIEQFITGADENDLKRIVERELTAIRSSESEDERESLGRYLNDLGKLTREAWADLVANPNDSALQERLNAAVKRLEDDSRLAATIKRLERWLSTQRVSVTYLEAQLYNYLLNFFELYYQNGDFGYNNRASQAFKVPYEADYDGSDTLFHWKHKDSYYIKTGASFPEVRVEIQGKKFVFRLQAGGDAEAETSTQNNNKESDIKHYRLSGIAEEAGGDRPEWVVRFTLAGASTSKIDLYAQLWRAAIDPERDITPYLVHGPEAKSVFKDLGKDYDKADGGQLKGINQLRLSDDAYRDAIAKNEAFKSLGKNADARAEALKSDPVAQGLHAFDRAINRFYIGQDADYFIHKDLHGFLTREKDRFIKNVIFSDLDTLLARETEPATLILARGFNAVASRIIEFLDALESFQRNLFTLKKKVIDTHWLISVGKIEASFYPRLLMNKRLLDYWHSEFKLPVTKAEEVAAHPTLVVDTSLFTSTEERDLIDEIIGGIDRLDEKTDGLLIHSESWQTLNLLQEKFREKLKCIYIDPPYNTGSDGFLYKDSFRHSSWTSMIFDRLEAGKCLLKPQGFVLTSIDRDEHENLQQAARSVFGAKNFIEEIVWQKAYGGGHKTKHINNLHEYILAYARDIENTPKFWLSPDPEAAKYYKFQDEKLSVRGRFRTQPLHTNSNDYRRNLTYPIPVPAVKPSSEAWRTQFSEIRESLRSDRLKVELTAKEDGDPIWQVTLDGQVWLGSLAKPEKQWQWSWDATKEALIDDSLAISIGKSGLVVEYKQYEFGVDGEERGRKPSSVQIGPYTQTGTSDLVNVLGFEGVKFPKPVGLIKELIGIGFDEPDSWVADYFAGSGTTGQAAIAINKAATSRMRRFLLSEIGDHFESVLKKRISRVMYTLNWKDGKPENEDGWQGLVKVQTLEQYEDTVTNLDVVWNEPSLPEGVPVRYLFRPEQNCVSLSIDLKQPFQNFIRVGKARDKRIIDLLESWAYFQGYWQRSRRAYTESGKRYACLETEDGTLVVLRDIVEPEDDSNILKTIVDRYRNEDGTPRLRALELNHWADLTRIESLINLPCTLIDAHDFDRGADWV